MHLIDKIKAKAKTNLQTVVLPESYDEFQAKTVLKR